MYHRFNETKYPSTNIQMEIFEKHINIIKSSGYDFLNPDAMAISFDNSVYPLSFDNPIDAILMNPQR